MNEFTASSATDQTDDQQFQLLPPKLLISGVFVLGLVLWGYAFLPQEIARWYHASARNALSDRDFDEVIEKANKGLSWNPDYTELLGLRAAVNLELDELELALKDFDRMIEIAALDNQLTEADISALAARTVALQRLNRFQEAVDTWTEIVDYRKQQFQERKDDASRQQYALSLNNRAYTQAQGKIDIPTALEDINEAIEILGREDDPIFIDTLGYLLLVDGNLEDAKFYLEQAVALAKTQDAKKREQIRALMQRVVDQRALEAELKRLDENYAVILHHRGEVYEAIGEVEQADADYEEAVKLGYNREKGIW
jgi:tetratricopeptide (TPR) repeat protein